jgi:hypothetical protein
VTSTPSPSQIAALSPSPGSSIPPDWDETVLFGPPYSYSLENHPEWTVNAEGTSGSGCEPPIGDGLPDGVWAGRVTEWGADFLAFDLACAYGPSTSRIQERLDVCLLEANDNEFLDCHPSLQWSDFENNNPRARELVLADDAVFINMWDPDIVDEHSMTWTGNGILIPIGEVSTLDNWDSRLDLYVWVYINDGLVTQVLECFPDP